jgi:hypothetical protein
MGEGRKSCRKAKCSKDMIYVTKAREKGVETQTPGIDWEAADIAFS